MCRSVHFVMILAAALVAALSAPADAQITGTFRPIQTSGVNLTAEGGIDWAIWGYANGGTSTSLSPDVRRAGGSHIPSLIDLSIGNPLYSVGFFTFLPLSTFTWSNGSPEPQGSGARGGLTHSGTTFPTTGEGFRLVLPADAAPRRIRLYVMLRHAVGRLTARLSDGSAPPWSYDLDATEQLDRPGLYEIQYAAASSNQTLEIDWVTVEQFRVTWGVVIQAAAIETPTVAGVPVFTPAGGTYFDYQNITIGSSSPGATIRYTLDGSAPGPQSPSIPSGGTVLVNQSGTTIRAYAEAAGVADSPLQSATYSLHTRAPEFSPAFGSPPLAVSITSATSDAMIYYTTDGSVPSPSRGTLYTGPVQITQDTDLHAIATKPGLEASDVTHGRYQRSQIVFSELGSVPLVGAMAIQLPTGQWFEFGVNSTPSYGEVYVFSCDPMSFSTADDLFHGRRHARGDRIDSSCQWSFPGECTGGVRLAYYSSGMAYGEWATAGQGYLGFRVYSGIDSLFNHGWVHLSNITGEATGFVLHSFALETAPGVPIRAGDAGCTADFNADGALNSQDVFDFLVGFFAGNADHNGDGITNSQDFFDFLAAFFAGC